MHKLLSSKLETFRCNIVSYYAQMLLFNNVYCLINSGAHAPEKEKKIKLRSTGSREKISYEVSMGNDEIKLLLFEGM